jgi:hypothetical protein
LSPVTRHELFHLAAIMPGIGPDQALSETGPARSLAHIHAPQRRLVVDLRPFKRPIAVRAEPFVVAEGAEDVAP